MEKQKKQTALSRVSWMKLALGVGFTLLVAFAGTGLAMVPGLHALGPLACAIFISILYRQFLGYPEALRAGIEFSAKSVLRFAIILFGLKLNIDLVIHQGLGLLIRDAFVIGFSIPMTIWLGKLFKADASLALLLGVGTGVCGAAAIAAVSPIIKAKDEDTAIGAGIIALVGTMFSLFYTIIRPFLSISAAHFGIWSGISLHEIAQVALAGASAGPDALAVALLAKLGRVLLLIPLGFILMYVFKRKQTEGSDSTNIKFPWFLIGFIIMSFLGSYVLGKSLPVPKALMDFISNAASFLLTGAMAGLGLNVNLRDLRSKAARPLAAMVLTSILLSILTFFIA